MIRRILAALFGVFLFSIVTPIAYVFLFDAFPLEGLKSRAALRGRCHVAIEDVQAVALPVLRHRIIPNFAARSEGMTPDSLIERLLKEIPANGKLLKKAG